MQPRAITLAILAMGGEGGGVLADWVVDLAEHAGYYAQATSVPGVAQRTGTTIYYVELFPQTASGEPVLALMPVPGEVDIVIASELMEAGRAVQRGLVTPDRTVLIASTHRVYSMTERTAPGDGRINSDALLAACRESSARFVRADFAAVAQQSGSVISAALFGALASTRALPFDRAAFEDAIRRGGVGVEPSLAAFAAGFQPADPVPESAHQASAIQRLTQYQDAQYAQLYLDRLAPIRECGDAVLLEETARYLALWMTYEDAIRVAALKIRRERFERVRRESRAAPGQLLHIDEFLHPRVEEIADILPASFGWARRLIALFTGRGRIVRTTSLFGFLQLYAIAALRPLRRKSLRFQREQKRIEEWLELVRTTARKDLALAREVAQYPRVLRGYGDTYAEGVRQFNALMKGTDAS
ncbi:putative indolepyruvate ferredoxin beta subunit oxidoreductase protein [Candidatus Sulfopaludibacter sp. SbA3]|nr:putative indolepyruvate ferredoxin beta subunit oxidoreductase protein [Candidatus Sulfopaludibacter sp. SbA3]